MTSRPLIGVSSSELRHPERVEPVPQGEPPRQRELALGLAYLGAIEGAGGLPVILPPLADDAVEPLLDRLHGVCLSGGPDLDPAGYGGAPHPDLGPTEPAVDAFELAVVRAADARGLPLLGICRGAQALNVARGGTLHPHLPARPGTLVHRQTTPCHELAHEVEIAPKSSLRGVLRRRRVDVNSFHHQAADALGEGLVAAAWAPDGVIEAIEAPEHRFLVGVQWHAECLVDHREHAALFAALIAAAGDYEARPVERAA